MSTFFAQCGKQAVSLNCTHFRGIKNRFPPSQILNGESCFWQALKCNEKEADTVYCHSTTVCYHTPHTSGLLLFAMSKEKQTWQERNFSTFHPRSPTKLQTDGQVAGVQGESYQLKQRKGEFSQDPNIHTSDWLQASFQTAWKNKTNPSTSVEKKLKCQQPDLS